MRHCYRHLRAHHHLARPMSTTPPCGQQSDARRPATYPELQDEGPRKLVVLGSEVGRNSNGDAQRLVRECKRPGSTTVLPSTLVEHVVCRSAAGGCQHCPRPAMAPTTACHQRRRPTARPCARSVFPAFCLQRRCHRGASCQRTCARSSCIGKINRYREPGWDLPS